MKKLKITLEIEAKHETKKRVSTLEKLISAFVRLASNLHSIALAKLLQLIVVLIALTYIICHILPLVLNRH